jgi:protein-glutamine gamma-glutamyltransferase
VRERTDSRALELLAFGALAAFAGLHWVTLVADPPLGRALLAALAACAGGAVLVRVGAGRLPRGGSWALAGVVAAATLALGLLALGLRAGLLVPGGWGELAHGIGQGLNGLADADYPYSGHNPWARLTILLALPLTLGVAAALAFWPGRGRRGGLALVLLIALYGVAVTVQPPPLPLLWGAILLALIAAWLWLPRLERSSAAAALAALATACAVGLGAAVLIDGDEPWLDWTSWRWPGDEPNVEFRWNHSYGPIDWPREGTALLRAESDDPHYWRTIALDRFDGFRWEVETETSSIYDPLELPQQVEGPSAGPPNPDWIEQVTFTVGALDSGLLVAPGAVRTVDGLDGVSPGAGSTNLTAESLGEGDEYTVTSYVPEPSAAQLRAAPEGYVPALRRYTQVELPRRTPAAEALSGSALSAAPGVSVPLIGSPQSAKVDQQLDRSLYADAHALASRLAAGKPTTYDAVTAIERHMRRSYAYDEAPPQRDVPLDSFLFVDRAGYCQQFSGAMALMLRTLGIPSRVASGFSSGEREQGGGAFQVSDRDAHSWVEVYFNGIGWVSFEPTPSAAPAGEQLTALAAVRGAAAAEGETLIPRRGLVIPTVAGRVGADPESGGGLGPALLAALLVLAALAAAAALALAALVAVRAIRFRSLPAAAAAEAQARELEQALPRLGFPIPEGATLLELERRLGNRRGIAHYLAGLRDSRYRPGGRPPDAHERRQLRTELSADRGIVRRLRALLAIPPGAPAERVRPRP